MASISEILMEQGRRAGDLRRQRANVWMPTIQHLANLPNQIMNDRAMEREAQEAAFDRGQQRDVRGQALAKGDAELAEKEASAAQKAHMNEVLSTEGVIGPDNVFNVGKAREIARSKRYQDITQDIENVAKEWNEAHAKQLQSDATLAKTEGDTRRAETGERTAANQQGVRRMIGESIANRGGQPFSAGDAQTVQGMALQEGIDLPKGILPEPEEEVSMVVRGPNGRPTRVMVPKSQLRNGGVEEYREPRAAGNTDVGPLETIIGADGKPIRVRREDAIGKAPASGTEKASSGVQKRVLNFFNRAEQADKDLEALEPEIEKQNLSGQAWQAFAPNFAQTQLGQSYTAAQRAFTEARLRKDSGAAIPDHEFKSDRQTYFVQPGDSKKTIQDKNRARAAMLASLAFESGQALGEFLGDSDEARATVDRFKARAAAKATGTAPQAPAGWKYVPKPGGGWTAVEDK